MKPESNPACDNNTGSIGRARVVCRRVLACFAAALLGVLGACHEASETGREGATREPVSEAVPPPKTEMWPAGSNVLLLTLDTTRFDALGCYNGDPATTPNLDAVAAKSHLFERCSTSIPQTLPAHVSLFSGLQPGKHGVRKNFTAAVSSRLPLLAEAFRQAGFKTGAFVSAFVLDQRFGLSRGFDFYDPSTFNVKGDVKDERLAADTVDAAIGWIKNQPEPWFVWVHLFDPHTPYAPPEPFAGRFPDNPYLGEVASMDAEIGRLLGALADSDMMDRTGIVICGDHGEGLGDHGEPTHGILLYESTTRVPLLVHTPGQTEGRRHQRPVALVDLAPTLLDVLTQTGTFDGESLLPMLGGRAAETASRVLFLESLEGFYRSGWSPIYALVQGPWKYISSPRPELYDVVADPAELENLHDRFPDVADRLQTELGLLIPDEDVALGTAEGLSNEEHAALTALGYVAGTPGRGAGSRKNPADLIHLVAIHQRALEAYNTGRLDEAAELFRRELKEDSESPLLHWYLGSCLISGRPGEASSLFRQAIELQPSFEEPYVALCKLLHDRRRIEGVVAVAREGVEKTSDTFGRLHYFRALGTLRTEGYERQVLIDLDVAVERGRAPVNAYRLRAGLLLRQLSEIDAALDDLERCVGLLNPEEQALLYSDAMFASLHGDPRFEELFATQR